jgi:hypothetical protein
MCRELNKEPLSSLELFKIGDRIWIKNQWSSRVGNSIEFDGIWFQFSRIEELWTRSSYLHLDNSSNPKKEFGISNLWVFSIYS